MPVSAFGYKSLNVYAAQDNQAKDKVQCQHQYTVAHTSGNLFDKAETEGPEDDSYFLQDIVKAEIGVQVTLIVIDHLGVG